MPTTRDLLDELTRDELILLADRCNLRVADRRVKAQLIDATARLPAVSLASYLGDLSRDRLKELCRSRGVDDSGREKSALVERLAPDPKPPASKAAGGGVAPPKRAVAAPPPAPSARSR